MNQLNYSYTSEKLSNGNTIKYKVIQETAYRKNTPDRVVLLLELARQNRTRLKITYGDSKTGMPWGDVESGYIGRSTGRIKIPLLVKTSRSFGGGGLLDDCIVKIEYANKKEGGILYQHPNFTTSINERLEYLRGELRKECISYGELAELQSLADYIEAGDVELLEAAGVPEKI